MRSWWRFSPAVLLIGCGGTSTYFPLARDQVWQYQFTTGLRSGAEPVKTLERTSLDGTPGWTMTGPLGSSRMAWRGSRLVAAELPGTRFRPPIPLLDSTGAEQLPPWQGTVTYAGTTVPASADVRQKLVKATVQGREMDGIQVTTRLAYENRVLETVTIFVRGIGPVEQVQRLDGQFVASMTYLSGP